MSFEQKVRERAYEIWMAAGQADGMAHAHWVEAETAVKGEAKPAKAVKKAAKPAVAAKAAKASKTPAKAAGKASSKTVIAKAAKAKPASELRH